MAPPFPSWAPEKEGAAKAAVVASGGTGLVSGSSIANIVTTGNFTIPLMIKIGYPAKKAAAIEVAASTDGQLMPPIMDAAAFMIAEYVKVPYGTVIKAAAIPALACAAAYTLLHPGGWLHSFTRIRIKNTTSLSWGF